MEKIIFDNFIYDDFYQLAKDSYKYPNVFNKFYNSNKFLLLLKEFDNSKYEKVIKLKEQDLLADVYTFLVSNILNPYMELSYQHFKFSSYEEIGKTILSYAPKIDVYLKDLLIYHLLSIYMENCKENITHNKIYLLVKEEEKQAINNPNIAYWTLGFKLSKTTSLFYQGKKFDDPYDFFKYISAVSDLINFSSSFLEDGYVISWLYLKGYTTLVDRYLSIIRNNENIANQLSKELSKQILKKVDENDK